MPGVARGELHGGRAAEAAQSLEPSLHPRADVWRAKQLDARDGLPLELLEVIQKAETVGPIALDRRALDGGTGAVAVEGGGAKGGVVGEFASERDGDRRELQVALM